MVLGLICMIAASIVLAVLDRMYIRKLDAGPLKEQLIKYRVNLYILCGGFALVAGMFVAISIDKNTSHQLTHTYDEQEIEMYDFSTDINADQPIYALESPDDIIYYPIDGENYTLIIQNDDVAQPMLVTRSTVDNRTLSWLYRHPNKNVYGPEAWIEIHRDTVHQIGPHPPESPSPH